MNIVNQLSNLTVFDKNSEIYEILTSSVFDESSDSLPASSTSWFDEFDFSLSLFIISLTLKSLDVDIFGYLSPNKSIPHLLVNLIISLSNASILNTKLGIVFPSFRARDLASKRFCFLPLLASSSFSCCLFCN